MSATPETDNDTQAEIAAWELLREARRERDVALEKVGKLIALAERALNLSEIYTLQKALLVELEGLKEDLE